MWIVQIGPPANCDEALLQVWWMLCALPVLLMLYGFVQLESGWAKRKHLDGITTNPEIFASMLFFSLFVSTKR